MLDDELRALLSAEPAPDFTARVREAVRHQRVHSFVAPPSFAPWMAFACAAIVLVFVLPYYLVAPKSVSRATLASTPVGTTHVPLMEPIAPTTVRPHEPGALTAAASARPRQDEPGFHFDPAEQRSLQALFARPPVAYLDVPEPLTDVIVIPEMTVEPLQFESLSEGASR